jgi:FdhE protein
VTEKPPRPPRAESREVVELKQIRASQPELASAVDMQLALVEMQRRIQGRVPLPWIHVDPEWAASQQRSGRPLVRFSDIPLEWSDFRLTFRQTADILHRYEALERADYDAIVAIGRDGNALEPILSRWYDATSGVDAGTTRERPADGPASLDQVLILALRPFLARCAEALAQRVDVSSWTHGHCPFCGWEPEFAAITPSADRRLICGRCSGQWAFAPLTCPFCANDDRALITSFATRDGRYRVYACDVCRRYLKAYDGRHATRPVMVSVDSIATLPLDAAAIQRGYVG